MTKHVVKGDISFECDDCGDILETNTGNWDAAMNIFRRNKWEARSPTVGMKRRNPDAEWRHLCGCTKARQG